MSGPPSQRAIICALSKLYGFGHFQRHLKHVLLSMSKDVSPIFSQYLSTCKTDGIFLFCLPIPHPPLVIPHHFAFLGHVLNPILSRIMYGELHEVRNIDVIAAACVLLDLIKCLLMPRAGPVARLLRRREGACATIQFGHLVTVAN